MKTIPFYFMRHGQTEWNTLRLVQGQTDIPLNEIGTQEARQVAELLATIHFTSIAVSPLTRARQTADIIAQQKSIPITIIDELKEATFGIQEGQVNIDGTWYWQWLNHHPKKGAEPFAAFTRRVAEGLHKSLELPGPVLIISHAAVYWALQSALNLPITDIYNCVPYHYVPPQPPVNSWSMHELTSKQI